MPNYESFAETPIATRPYGPVEGVDTADQSFFARQAKLQSLQDMYTAQQQRQAELQRYQGETPNKLAVSDLEGATARAGNTPSNIQGLISGQQGAAQSQAAKGSLDTALSPGNIEVGKAEQKNKLSAAKLSDIQNTVSLYKAQMGSNLLQAPELYKQMLGHLPEEVRSQFPESFSPKALSGLDMMMKSLAQTIPHIQEMEKARALHENQIEVAKIQAKAAVDAASIRSSARVKGMATLYNEALAKGNDEGIIAAGRQLITDPDVDDASKERIKKDIEDATKRFAVKLAPKYQPDLGGGAIPGTAQGIPDIMNQLNGGGMGQKTPEGYDILGKNPDGSFRIKDPKTGRTGTYKP